MDTELVRLFSALLPPPDVVESLRDRIRQSGADGGQLSWSPVERWHVTLGFFGDQDDQEARERWLESRLVGRQGIRIQLACSGNFGSTLWVGVRGAGLLDLAEAAGADRAEREFLAHLTLGRTRSAKELELWRRRLTDYIGPVWTADEVVLLGSESSEQGVRYTALSRFPLATPHH